MSRELFNDLVAKLGKAGASDTPIDFKAVLSNLESLGESEREPQVSQSLNELRSVAQSFSGNKKYKEAAAQYYVGGMIARHFFSRDSSAYSPWFSNASNSLVLLAQEYVAWKEIDRAAAAISLASLLGFLGGDWNLQDYYGQFLKNHASEIQRGKTASGSLWVPNYLVTAISQLNPEVLQQADTFASTYLLAEAKTASQYRDGINLVLNLARAKLQGSIKVPTLEVEALLPKDVLFDEKIIIKLVVKHKGEGEARDAQLVFQGPSDVPLIGGIRESKIGTMKEGQAKTIEFQFTLPKTAGVQEKSVEFSGQLSFQDMVGNRRTFVVGPYAVVVRVFRKADQLREELAKVESEIGPGLSQLHNSKSVTSFERQTKSILSFIESIKSETAGAISNGDFVLAQLMIMTLRDVRSHVLDPEVEVLSWFSTFAQQVSRISTELRRVASEQNTTLQMIETQAKKLKQVIENKSI
ncbi:MAG TPA: hypothetical protein VJ044_11535 [Candidatus Hodarchaeales archaeon]|nr:hypothetical protein [Candidatus Hodarchaeales archaeon]